MLPLNITKPLLLLFGICEENRLSQLVTQCGALPNGSATAPGSTIYVIATSS